MDLRVTLRVNKWLCTSNKLWLRWVIHNNTPVVYTCCYGDHIKRWLYFHCDRQDSWSRWRTMHQYHPHHMIQKRLPSISSCSVTMTVYTLTQLNSNMSKLFAIFSLAFLTINFQNCKSDSFNIAGDYIKHHHCYEEHDSTTPPISHSKSRS